MKLRTILAALTSAGVGSVALAAGPNISVHPWTYDPANTNLVSSKWVEGLGCPTNAKVAIYPATKPNGTYTDPACATGDSKDNNNFGLVLGKSGPTGNNAAGGAGIDGVNNVVLTEVGYDIQNASHCGAGAPRFDITTKTGKSYFLGCNSPPPDTTVAGTSWKRLRWGNGAAASVMGYNYSTYTLEPITDPIKSIDLVFDEGTDQGTGVAILDNIDVNGSLSGKQ